jgi:predicted dithiol-disulfide oxidoreductase (DUF899 family)
MNIVSKEQWLEARNELLRREKAFTHEREALAAARRELPAVKVDTAYRFDGILGSYGLADLFAGKRQLIVYHFMFAPTWQQGCAHCSYVADHLDGSLPHLAARDTALAVVSRAPLAKLQEFKQRMGWQFPWYSAGTGDFNYDYQVSFRDEALKQGTARYNYGTITPKNTDMPGFSVFMRDGDDVLHTYSQYSRGIDQNINTYNLLDMTALGRHEEGRGMSWVRYHDRYAHSG